MTPDLAALAVHARDTPADERARVNEAWRRDAPPGGVLLTTCHRVEIYGPGEALRSLGASTPTARCVTDVDVVRHLVTLAVGRDSAVVGEDQVLHQLRGAVHEARTRGPIVPQLDRAIDLALRAGRLARTWLPPSRPSLVDLALQRAVRDADLSGARVLVVGAGEIGRQAVARLAIRGAHPILASRTRDSALLAAGPARVEVVEFDPGSDTLATVAGVVIALAGSWTVSPESHAALARARPWLIDLSSPPALDEAIQREHADRLVTIDDLARGDGMSFTGALMRRLDALIDETVASYERWVATDSRRAAAEALNERAREVRTSELDLLWRRVPGLDASERAEVERAVAHLTERLLRDPLEQLRHDADGSNARAARALFRL